MLLGLLALLLGRERERSLSDSRLVGVEEGGQPSCFLPTVCRNASVS